MPENNGPQFNFKENYLNYLNHKPTSLIPNSFVGNKVMGFGALNGPSIEKGAQFGDCMDGFGIRWEFKPRVNVRVDWGFTKTGNSIVFNIGEAF